MIATIETGRIYRVAGDNARIVSEDLNAAVDVAQQHAVAEHKHGVLVARHGPASFTVAVSGDVPYGSTQYDYLAIPEDGARTASQIPGAEFIEMEAIGHFPMSENYPVFKGYLVQALDLIGAKTSVRA